MIRNLHDWVLGAIAISAGSISLHHDHSNCDCSTSVQASWTQVGTTVHGMTTGDTLTHLRSLLPRQQHIQQWLLLPP